jgi:hypothetical protein
MESERQMSASRESGSPWHIEGNPRWPYEKYVRTYFGKPLQYTWVRQKHDLTLTHLRQTAIAPYESSARHLSAVLKIEQAGFHRLFEFLDAIATQAQVERMMDETGIERDDMEAFLDFVKRRWFIPQPVQARQLFDTSDEALFVHFEALKRHKVANSYALLERGRTRAGREALAAQTGVPEDVILDFVNRADITRMPWVGGRMVKQLWALGYTSLEQLRNADPQDYYARMQEHYRSLGTSKPFDATPKTAQGLIDAANRLPTLVEV